MSKTLLLTELTTTMMREVFQAVTDSAMEQTDAFVDLAGRVGVPLEVYQGKILGVTPAERDAKALDYVIEVVFPLLSLVAQSPPADPVIFDDAAKQALVSHYYGALTGAPPGEQAIDDVITGQTPTWSIPLDDLVAFTLAKLMRDTNDSYAKLRALLGAGMQQIVVTGGQICTKVTMQVEDPSAGQPVKAIATKSGVGLRVRLADEQSAVLSRSAELVGSVKIDFRTTTFPALPLPVSAPSGTPAPALPRPPLFLGEALVGIWGSGPSDVYLVAGSGAVLYKGKGSGWTLQAIQATNLRGIWGSGPGDLYLTGTLNGNGVILRGKDGGSPWSAVGVPDPALAGIWGSGGADVYAVGSSGVLHSMGNNVWTPQTPPHLYQLNAVWGSGPNDVYAVGDHGTILHTSDGGAHWDKQDSGVGHSLNAVWGSGPGDVYVVGGQGTILRADPGGQWKQQSSGTVTPLTGVWGSGADHVYAVGDFGRILHSSNHGATWVPRRIGAGFELMSGVWGSGPGDVYAVCNNGMVLRSTDGGVIWA